LEPFDPHLLVPGEHEYPVSRFSWREAPLQELEPVLAQDGLGFARQEFGFRCLTLLFASTEDQLGTFALSPGARK
jgi:hypothetical protein